VESAHHRVAAPRDIAVLDRLEAALAEQGDPPITMRRGEMLVFECATGPFMLRARVADALMRACGHDEWQRVFRPLD
jgi:hypothetical protein